MFKQSLELGLSLGTACIHSYFKKLMLTEDFCAVICIFTLSYFVSSPAKQLQFAVTVIILF